MNYANHILLVSEKVPAESALGQALQALGCELSHATNSTAALQELKTGTTQVLLIDGRLAEEDKARLMAFLEDCAEEVCPAVLAYSDGNSKALKALVEAGLDYLLPPFDPVFVKGRLNASLARRAFREKQRAENEYEVLLKLERDVQIGRDIQRGFLPQTLPQPPGWELTACFHPAREVAGDFYDAFYLINKRRLGFLIADVCDKGVGAALFMALFRTLIRSGAQHHTSLGWMDPRSVSVTENKDWLKGDPSERRQSLPTIGTGSLMNGIAGTNDYITENHLESGYFATVFFGMLDPSNGSLIYINGGHNPPVIIRKEGAQAFLKPTGPAVGMLPGVQFKMGQTRLGPGDILYLYTDGVTDARSPEGAFFSEGRLFSLLGQGAPSAQALVDEVERQLKEHIGNAAQFDDITMMALHRIPKE